jgi:hypothetical protein
MQHPRRPVQHRPTIRVAPMDQRGICLQQRDDSLLIARPHGFFKLAVDLVRRSRLIEAAAAQFFLIDDGDDFVITAVDGESQCSGGVAVRPDSPPGIGAVFHQQAHHCRIAA